MPSNPAPIPMKPGRFLTEETTRELCWFAIQLCLDRKRHGIHRRARQRITEIGVDVPSLERILADDDRRRAERSNPPPVDLRKTLADLGVR